MLSCAFSSTSVTLMSTKPEDRSSRTAQSHHSGERVDGDLELGEAQHDVQLGCMFIDSYRLHFEV